MLATSGICNALHHASHARHRLLFCDLAPVLTITTITTTDPTMVSPTCIVTSKTRLHDVFPATLFDELDEFTHERT
jgi:hypothetical protein